MEEKKTDGHFVFGASYAVSISLALTFRLSSPELRKLCRLVPDHPARDRPALQAERALRQLLQGVRVTKDLLPALHDVPYKALAAHHPLPNPDPAATRVLRHHTPRLSRHARNLHSDRPAGQAGPGAHP